jgi:hypothetical protein
MPKEVRDVYMTLFDGTLAFGERFFFAAAPRVLLARLRKVARLKKAGHNGPENLTTKWNSPGPRSTLVPRVHRFWHDWWVGSSPAA